MKAWIKNSRRPLVTLLILGAAFAAFIFHPASRTVTETTPDSRTVTLTYDASGRFFEWVGIFLLALSVWIWRDKLKLTSVGPLGGLPMTQQTPEEIRPLESGSDPAVDLSSRMQAQEDAEARNYVLDYLREHYALTDAHLALELKMPVRRARFILNELVATGQLRRDGFPRHTLYTLSASLENRALDYVRDHVIAPQYRLLSERRFVRIRGVLEADAVLECEERTFVVEVKYLRSNAWRQVFDAGLQHLQRFHKELSPRQIAGILVLVTVDPSHVLALTRMAALTSPESGGLPIRVVVVSQAELTDGTHDS